MKPWPLERLHLRSHAGAWERAKTFFFTVNLLERRRRLLTDDIDDLRIVFST